MLSRYKTYLTQFSRTEDLNKRIYARNNPSTNLMLPLSFRSVNTRVTMPVPIKEEDTQKVHCLEKEVFIPGNDSKNYYISYASNVDVDSELKNINKHLESDLNIYNSYVPNSNSDLYLENYNTDVPIQILKTSGGVKTNISSEFFNNHTRQQLKNS